MFSTLWKAAFVEKLEEKIHLWRPFFRLWLFPGGPFRPVGGGAFAPIAPPPAYAPAYSLTHLFTHSLTYLLTYLLTLLTENQHSTRLNIKSMICFAMCANKLWKSFDESFKSSLTGHSFKHKLKSHLLSLYLHLNGQEGGSAPNPTPSIFFRFYEGFLRFFNSFFEAVTLLLHLSWNDFWHAQPFYHSKKLKHGKLCVLLQHLCLQHICRYHKSWSAVYVITTGQRFGQSMIGYKMALLRVG